jgi:hypothetical protein
MAAGRLVRHTVLLGLLAAQVSAQITVSQGPGGIAGLTFQGIQAFTFDLQPMPPSLPFHLIAGSSSRGSNGPTGGEVVAHRYFYDEDKAVYFGYDLLLELDSQTSSYRIRFFELGIGPLDVVPRPARYDPSAWKKLSLPSLPAARTVQPGDTIPVDLWVDPATGQKLVDNVRIQTTPQFLQVNQRIIQSMTTLRGGAGPPQRSIPTVSGAARSFSAEDSEMRLAQPRITVNGVVQESTGRTANAGGTLIWFHLPKRGRYILSLAPRPELGFVKAGEVRGGAITFTLDKDEFLLESPIAIASGSAPYILYVLHDAEWEPTGMNQGDRMQFGSVAPGEIALLQKK